MKTRAPKKLIMSGPKAFEQAIGMVARGGTVSLNGLPLGIVPFDNFGTVLNRIAVRGSIVGTRLGLQASLDFAAAGKVKATFAKTKFEDMNDTLDHMRKRPIEGRITLDLAP
jgi:propanol-preferring alcohol dehydrogenase